MRCKTMLLLTLTLSASARAWYNLDDCGGGPSQSSKFFDPMASITLERFYDPKCGCNVTFLGQFCRVGFPLKITIECNSVRFYIIFNFMDLLANASGFTHVDS